MGTKGSAFEREIATDLSLWWSGGERDDIFWRTSGSGARAKTRSYVGKTTYGQHGDIGILDPIGSPLTRLCNIELKVGYNKWSIMDVLDKPERAAKQLLEQFLDKTIEDASLGGTPYPCLITHRDKRVSLIFYPRAFHVEIENFCGSPQLRDCVGTIRFHWMGEPFVVMRLEDWLKWVTPDSIIELYSQFRAGKLEVPSFKRPEIKRIVRVVRSVTAPEENNNTELSES